MMDTLEARARRLEERLKAMCALSIRPIFAPGRRIESAEAVIADLERIVDAIERGDYSPAPPFNDSVHDPDNPPAARLRTHPVQEDRK